MQAFLNLPNWAKALFAFIGIVGLVAGYQGLQTKSNLVNNLTTDSQPPTLKDVNIIVKTKELEPIANVKVEVISNGPPTSKITDNNGYVEIQIPSRKSVEINLSKLGYQNVKYLINLETDPQTTRTITLEPVQPPK